MKNAAQSERPLQQVTGEPQRRYAVQTRRDTGQLIHLLMLGAIVGMIGGVLMALFTLLATATYLQIGFLTPLYCTGYLAHLFGKSHHQSDRASLHWLQMGAQPG